MSADTCKLTVIMSFTKAGKELRKVFASFKKQQLSAGKLQIIFFDDKDNAELQKKVAKATKDFDFTLCKTQDEVLKNIKGKYVNFSNGQDKWYPNALDKLCGFLDRESSVGCVLSTIAARQEDNKQAESSEPLIFDIEQEPEHVREDLKRFVFRRELLDKVPHLDNQQTIDNLLLSLELIIKSGKLAILQDAFLRVKEGSSIEIENMEGAMERCMELSQAICGKVNDYTYHQMFSILYKNIRNQGNKEAVINSLQKVPDRIIAQVHPVGARKRFFEERIYAYRLKYQGSEAPLVLDENGRIYLENSLIIDVAENNLFQISILTVDPERNLLILEGKARTNSIDENAEHFIRDEKGQLYPLDVQPFKHDNLYGCENEIIQPGFRFFIELPLHFGMKIEFAIKHSATGNIFPCKFNTGNFVKIHPIHTRAYYVKKPYMLQKDGNGIKIEKNSSFKHLRKELSYMMQLMKSGHRGKVGYRMAYWFMKAFGSRKPIWIINDRPHNAGDNGEALFKYLMNSPLKKTHQIYFMLSKDSPDYDRLTKIGPVLDYYSYKHKLKFLLSDKIISSIGNELPTNPFGNSRKMYNDLYKADFVYLRHGVSHNDQSGWLNKLKRNYAMINSSAVPEYESLKNENYLYYDGQAVLCGLPRFDNLYSDNKNKIAFLPTWRRALQGEKEEHSEKRMYSDAFIESQFYKFYNGLINDERLHKVMKEHGFTGDFYLHPVMSAQTNDFQENEFIKVHTGVADYQKVFRESNVMITDYSSVAFDFAYLKKPVIYAQFDFSQFYAEHSWDKGYFSYDKDALGLVTYDYETTLNAIINYIENGCEMEDEYRTKVENFFPYTDRNNCARIVEAIQKIDN